MGLGSKEGGSKPNMPSVSISSPAGTIVSRLHHRSTFAQIQVTMSPTSRSDLQKKGSPGSVPIYSLNFRSKGKGCLLNTRKTHQWKSEQPCSPQRARGTGRHPGSAAVPVGDHHRGVPPDEVRDAALLAPGFHKSPVRSVQSLRS